MPQAQAAAEDWIRRGVAVDGGDPQARSVLGVVLYMRGDHVSAVFEARNALALSPGLADAHGVLGAALIFSGRRQEGLSSLETCIRLDPRNPRSNSRLLHKAIAHYFCKDYEASATATAELIRLYPKYPFPYRWRAAALGQLGRVDEGRRALEQAIAMGPEIFDMFVRKGVVWMDPADHAHMVEGLRKVGLLN